MERTDVREPGGEAEPVATDIMAGLAWMQGQSGAGVAQRPEVRRLRTVECRWDVRQHLYQDRFRKHCSLVRGVILNVETEDTCNTKLDCVAEISTIGRELVEESKVN